MSKYDDLVRKLKETFQIDRPELDFGVYRILNVRAGEINDYLENRIKVKVVESLATWRDAHFEVVPQSVGQLPWGHLRRIIGKKRDRVAKRESRMEKNNSEIIIYQTEDGATKINVRLEGNSVWLTQSDLVELFQSSKSNISEHLKHIFEEGELIESAVVRKFRTTAPDVKNYGNRGT